MVCNFEFKLSFFKYFLKSILERYWFILETDSQETIRRIFLLHSLDFGHVDTEEQKQEKKKGKKSIL